VIQNRSTFRILHLVKKKWLSLVLCFTLGFCGFHQFYLCNYNRAFFYGLFFWTGIPFIFSTVDFWMIVFTSKKEFDKKYNTVVGTGSVEGLKRYLEGITFSFLLLFS
jgi:TM2 domain-containing membrane protein YozV